jgi:DNA-binding CsgD family transcriptional regulator
LTLLAETGDTWYLASPLSGLASVAALTSAPERAARLFGAVDALRERSGAHVFPTEGRRSERATATARAALGDDAFARACAAGRSLTLEEAVAEAVTPPGAGVVTDVIAASQARRFGLTPREIDVLRLLVEGRSDREIAEAFFISRHTAMKHVGNILGKLGVGSRTAAATLAHQERLI